jgi:hypothetical protein
MGISGKRSQSSLDQFRATYRIDLFFLIGNLIISVILVFIQKGVISHRILTVWFCSNLLITAIRFFLVYRYKFASVKSLETIRWDKLHIAGVILNGIVWGSAGIFLFPRSSPSGFSWLCIGRDCGRNDECHHECLKFPIPLLPCFGSDHGPTLVETDMHIGMAFVLPFRHVVLINAGT